MNDVEGVLAASEGEFLSQMAALSEGVILEIGSYKGRSTCYIASSTESKVVALDLWDLREAGFKPSKRVAMRGFYKPETYEIFKKNIRRKGLANVTPVKGDSKEVGKIWNIPLGMLWIDGDHSYAGVLSDYLLFSGFVKPGGFLVFHDFVIEDVRRVIETHVIPSGLWEDYKMVETVWAAKRKPQQELT